MYKCDDAIQFLLRAILTSYIIAQANEKIKSDRDFIIVEDRGRRLVRRFSKVHSVIGNCNVLVHGLHDGHLEYIF